MRQLPIMCRMIVRSVLSCPPKRHRPATRVVCHTDDTNKQQLADVIFVRCNTTVHDMAIIGKDQSTLAYLICIDDAR